MTLERTNLGGILVALGFVGGVAMSCKGGDSGPKAPGDRFCDAVAEQVQSCGAGSPCDQALVDDCAAVAAIFNDSYMAAAAECIEGGMGIFDCLVSSRSAIQPSAAHESFASAFCSECALGAPGCEAALFGGGEGDLALASALILPLGDAVVGQLESECATGLTCLATFSTCAQEVLVSQALPTETATCLVEQLVSGGGGGGGCGTQGGDGNDDGNDDGGDGSGTDTDTGGPTGGTADAGDATDTDPTGATDDTGPGGGDPNYPPPDGMSCPAGTAGPVSVGMGGSGFCAPPCDGGGGCPDPATGTALGFCIFNPASSNDPCMIPEDCTVAGEFCNGSFCELDPSHCGLLCDLGETCPDGMECVNDFSCEYPT